MTRLIQGIEETASYNVGPTSSLTLMSFRVPSGCSFKITHFANYLGSSAAWGFITWNVSRNGIIIPELANVKDQLGKPDEPRILAGTYLLEGGSQMVITAFNSHVSTTFAVGAAYKGELFKYA